MPRFPILSSLLLAVACGTAAAQSGPLTIDVSIDSDPRRAGPGELTVVVRNTGGSAIVLPATPDFDVAGGLRIEVTAPDGTVTTLAPLPGPEDEDDFTLAAGSGLGVSRVLEPGAFAQAGTYTLRVRHGSSVSPAVEVDIGD